MTATFQDRVQEVERLAHEINHILSHDRHTLERWGGHRQASVLANWGDDYHHGLSHGADDENEFDAAWLIGLSDRLWLESGEARSLDDIRQPQTGGDGTSNPQREGFIASAQRMRKMHRVRRRPSREFTPDDLRATFELFSQSMTKEAPLSHVKDLMKKDPVIVPPDMTLREAAQEMQKLNCGVLPVGSLEKVDGVITDRDIVLRAVATGKDINRELVRDYMTGPVHTVHEDDTPDYAADMMREHNINRVLVEDKDGKPCGILTFGSLMRKGDNMREIVSVIEYVTGRKAA